MNLRNITKITALSRVMRAEIALLGAEQVANANLRLGGCAKPIYYLI
jgi:hypothetical protein